MNQVSNPDDFQCYQVIAWLREAQDVHNKTQDYPPEPINRFLQEFCKIFKQMSKLLGIAFSDVNEKVGYMRARAQEYSGQADGLFAIIQLEKQRKVIELNGENNGSITKDKALKNYVSFGRSLLRMMRFMDYLRIMFSEITQQRTMKISDACYKAYMEALYPHHTFLVQTAAKLAMSAAPDRKRILQLFIATNGGETEAYIAMTEFVEAMEPIRVNMWKYYQDNGLMTLP